MKRMIAITISPGAATEADLVIAPWLVALTTAPPAPTSTRKKVPSSSEKSRRHSSRGSSKLAVAGNSRAVSAWRHLPDGGGAGFSSRISAVSGPVTEGAAGREQAHAAPRGHHPVRCPTDEPPADC